MMKLFEEMISVGKRRFFSSSTSSAPLRWISPLRSAPSSRKPDPTPPRTSIVESKRKSKFITHEAAVSMIKHERDPQQALETFNMVAGQKGFNHNNATYAIILQKLARSKKIQAVDAILRQMTYDTCEIHEGIFLNLMKHFSELSLHEKVLEMFDAIQMISREKPSLKAISTCLNLLVESNQTNLAQDFLLKSKRFLRLKPNTCIFNIFVKHHCKKGDVECAFEVVKEMKKSQVSYPNVITYSTVMDGLCKSGRMEEAIQLFEEMVSKEQTVPDNQTYNVLISGFCSRGKVDRARKILDFMKNNGCNPNIFNYSTLMSGFSKEGRWEDAKEVFEEMKRAHLKPDMITYTTLISCFCKAGKVDEAIDLLKEMREQELRADIVTFNVLLSGLCAKRRHQEALQMLKKLPAEGIYLNKASYRIVLNSLCQKDCLDNASTLLDLMLRRGFVPHYATSNELLICLCKAEMVDDAVTALFGLAEAGFKPEPDCWAVFVELNCKQRKLLSVFELIDELVS